MASPKTLKLIFARSKSGHTLDQIAKLTGLTIDQVKKGLEQATGLTSKSIGIIFHMKKSGLSLEQINRETDVELEVLKKFLPEVIEDTVHTQIDALADQGKGPYEISLRDSERVAYTPSSPEDCKTYGTSPPTMTEETKEPHRPQPTKPQHSHTLTSFYGCQYETNMLNRVNLLTGEEFDYEIRGYQFSNYCRVTQLPGGSLLITGGFPAVIEVVQIDTLREFAVSSQPPMQIARGIHAAVYQSQYLYVLGGYNANSVLRECERYVCAERRWEVLPALPVAGYAMSAVVLDNSLYAIGGYAAGENLDTVQMLSLDSLTWELMRLRLPQAARYIPFFKTDTEVLLLIKETLYSFTPVQVKPVKTLTVGIECCTSYYSRGTLYMDFGSGILSLGELI
jgi:hypothetical protein